MDGYNYSAVDIICNSKHYVKKRLISTWDLQVTSKRRFQVWLKILIQEISLMQMKQAYFIMNYHQNHSLPEECVAKGAKRQNMHALQYCFVVAWWEKLRPMVKGNAACPSVFHRNRISINYLPLTWHHNKRSWTTTFFFDEFLKDLNRNMKRQKLKSSRTYQLMTK